MASKAGEDGSKRWRIGFPVRVGLFVGRLALWWLLVSCGTNATDPSIPILRFPTIPSIHFPFWCPIQIPSTKANVCTSHFPLSVFFSHLFFCTLMYCLIGGKPKVWKKLRKVWEENKTRFYLNQFNILCLHIRKNFKMNKKDTIKLSLYLSFQHSNLSQCVPSCLYLMQTNKINYFSSCFSFYFLLSI